MTTRWGFRWLAALAAFACVTGTSAADPDAAGVVKTSQGAVTVERAGGASPATPGMPVFSGDRVRTAVDGYVGITLRDDTRLTAGPQSTLLINDFQFNANTNNGSLVASLLKGTFSVVTGLIAKHSPKQVEFRTPTMTLGIRGTEFIVDVAGEAE